MLVNQIEVDEKPLPLGDEIVLQVMVSSQENQHEQAIITTKLAATEVEALKDKTIAFTYGPRANQATFHGYVNTITVSKTYQRDGVYDIACFGCTSPLQEGRPRFFVDKTGPQIVSEIVTSHNLGVQVDEHAFRFPSYAQTDDTDWATIVDVASNFGWAVYTHNGVVRMADPSRLLTETGPVLRLIRGNDVLDKTRQLLDFMPESKSDTLASLVTPVFAFFDGDKVALTHKIDKKHRLYTDSPSLNRAMAEIGVKMWESNPTAWTQHAQGRIQGNPKITPGVVVDIQSTGSSVIEHDYDGAWLVRGVQHILTAKSFQTLLTLSRKEGVKTSTTEYRPFWTNAITGRPQVVRNGDVWESSWKSVSTVSSHLNPVKSTTSNHIWKVP